MLLGKQMKYLLIINVVVTAALAFVVYQDHQKAPVIEGRQELVRLINANVACLTESSGGAPVWFTDWEYVDACLNDKGWLPWPRPPDHMSIWDRASKGMPTQVEMLERGRASKGQKPGAAGAIEHSLQRIQGLIENIEERPQTGGSSSFGKTDFKNLRGAPGVSSP
jgi:hypothetical protein